MLEFVDRDEGKSRIVFTHLALVEIHHREVRMHWLRRCAGRRHRYFHIITRSAEKHVHNLARLHAMPNAGRGNA